MSAPEILPVWCSCYGCMTENYCSICGECADCCGCDEIEREAEDDFAQDVADE